MLKRNYYYLVAGFPDIVLDQKKIPFSLAELKQELKYHLHADDYRLHPPFYSIGYRTYCTAIRCEIAIYF